MPSILHDFPINAPLQEVYDGFVTAAGLEKWWAKSAMGKPAMGEEYQLGFGPEYDWRAVVSKCVLNKSFEWTMTKSDSDWQGSKVGIELEQKDSYVQVRFYKSKM